MLIRSHPPVQRPPSPLPVVWPLLPNEEQAIRAWLRRIGETDLDIVRETIERCRTDISARAFFLRRAASQPDREKTETPQPFKESTEMLTVSETGSFELPPAGAFAARCAKLIDLGTQESTFQGETKAQKKVMLTFALAEQKSDGSPFEISRKFTLSLHKQATLRGFLQSWRGRDFSSDELKAFDLQRLGGAPCLLNVVHVERNGKQYANIMNVSPLPKGMSAPPEVKPIIFDVDAQDAETVFESLSDRLQETIAQSPEWQARTGQVPSRTSKADASDYDDDIPF